MVYTQPAPFTDVTPVESCDKVCEATDEQGDTYVDYTIDCTDGLTINRKINLMDWMDSCKSNGEVIMETFANMLDALIPMVAQKQAEQMNPLIGNWSSDVNPAWLTVDEFLEVETKYSGGTNNPQWFERVNSAKVMTGFCAPTLITGGSDLWSAWRLLNVGCCTNDGLDALEILRQYGEAVVYDRWIAAEFGNDVSLMIQSNSIQLINAAFNFRFMDFNSLADLDLSMLNGWNGIIQDPISGLYVDLNLKVDCGVVHIIMTQTSKTVGLPNNMYPVGHPNEFVNFVTGIQVTNP